MYVFLVLFCSVLFCVWVSVVPAPFVEKTAFDSSFCFCSFLKDHLTVFMGVVFGRSALFLRSSRPVAGQSPHDLGPCRLAWGAPVAGSASVPILLFKVVLATLALSPFTQTSGSACQYP